MANIKKSVKVTQRTFDHAKLLLKAGETQIGVADYLALSKWTVGVISRSDSFDEYKNTLAAMYAKQKENHNAKKEPEKKPEIIKQDEKNEKNDPIISDYKLPGGTMSANYQMNRLVELVKKQNEILELISNKMAFIVEALS